MKGIVFTEFFDLVEHLFGANMVDDILDDAAVPSGGAYTAVGTYPHEEMVSLVTALSKRADLPVPTLIHAFGKHLFTRFSTLYPVFFQGITDAYDFLESIESIVHVEVLKLYPDAQLPRFETERSGDNLTMIYRSPRHFADLAAGLIDGCIAHYGGGITMERLDHSVENGSLVHFRLHRG